MRTSFLSLLALLALVSGSCVAEAPTPTDQPPRPDVSDTIVGMERGALDRWSNADPEGYLAIMADDVTYFDPTQDRRVEGVAAMRAMLAPMTGKFKIDRYEMVNPKVQRVGDVAVLTYNLVNYRKLPSGAETTLNRWNTTEVFREMDGQWKIVSSHFSYTKPELKQTGP
jgi:uncharacterized protein (TIGR02246 family)